MYVLTGILAYANGLVCYYALYSSNIYSLISTCNPWATTCYVSLYIFFENELITLTTNN